MFRMCGCGPTVGRRIASLAIGPDEPVTNIDVGINTMAELPALAAGPDGQVAQGVAISPTLTFKSVYSALSAMTSTTDLDITPLYHQFTVQPELQATLSQRELDQLISFLCAHMQHRTVSQRCSMPLYVDVQRDKDALASLASLGSLDIRHMETYAKSFLQHDSLPAFYAAIFHESPFRHLVRWKDTAILHKNRYDITITQETLLRILANYLSSHWSDTAGIQLYYAVRADLKRHSTSYATISGFHAQSGRKSSSLVADSASSDTGTGTGTMYGRRQNRMLVLSRLKCGTLLRITGTIEPDEDHKIDCFDLCCFFEVLLSLLDAVL